MIDTLTMYQLVCDGCRRTDDTGEFYAWATADQARQAGEEDGWWSLVTTNGPTWDFCPECWAWDDDDNRIYIGAAAQKAANLPPLGP